MILDAITQLVLEDIGANTCPIVKDIDAGKCWFILNAPTGNWAEHSAHIALCTGASNWLFIKPKNGWHAYIKSIDKYYHFKDNVLIKG